MISSRRGFRKAFQALAAETVVSTVAYPSQPPADFYLFVCDNDELAIVKSSILTVGRILETGDIEVYERGK